MRSRSFSAQSKQAFTADNGFLVCSAIVRKEAGESNSGSILILWLVSTIRHGRDTLRS